MKQCSKCQVEKPETEFHKNKCTKDGLTSTCKPCAIERTRLWGLNNKARAVANRKATYAKNRNRAIAEAHRWKTENRDRVNAWHRNWNAANKERVSAKVRKWQKANQDKVLAAGARRRAAKQRAMPKWADHRKIERIYRAAWMMNLTVDHIVPLISPRVCGLHVEHNLQLLPAQENVRKGNRIWPDMPA